jgi:hypothetical protein
MKNLISCTTSDMNFFEEQKYQNMLRDGVNTYFPADLKSEKQVNITIEMPTTNKMPTLYKNSSLQV